MQVTTNNIPREVVYGWELSEKERAEFDYLDFSEEGEGAYAMFFRYKGWVYHLGDAMRVEEGDSLCKGWHGYFGESFFSAVVFKYHSDDQVIVGHAFC